MTITLDQLRAIAPKAPGNDLPYLNAALAEGGITSPVEIAHFLGQLAVECIEFTTFGERWGPTADQLRYERPVVNGELAPPSTDPNPRHWPLWQRLGNTEPGDGRRFSGHGGIQLTGRANHAACGADLGLDLVSHPELAAAPENRYRVSVWFWKKHGLRKLAADGDVVGITREINGLGMYQLRQRMAYTDTGMVVLGALAVCSG